MNKQPIKKQVYLVLPVLGLPFIAMLFWALGGGQGKPAQGSDIRITGLNPELPHAQFEEDINAWDKLKIYEKALRDSLAQKEAKKNDPYFHFSTLTEMQEEEQKRIAEQNMINASLGKKDQLLNTDETKVQQRLDQLYKAINPAKEEIRTQNTINGIDQTQIPNPQLGGDVDRLEELMVSMNQGRQDNPELTQMDNMLEKILDIQHPERVADKIQESKSQQTKKSLPVTALHSDRDISLIETSNKKSDSTNHQFNTTIASSNSFLGLSDESSVTTNNGNVLEAVVHDTQTLMAGSIVKLRLTKAIDINGNHIPENNFIFGVASINGERLDVEITSIRYQNLLLPVALAVYDLDGMNGIFIPGAIERDAAKQSTSQSIQQMQMMSSMSQSIGAQAAGAGIEAAKGLFSKKIKLVKVTVKAGYQVLLRDPNLKE
ncbi:MAG TPA: conjugative transposon protein TraM [Cyclobacteriaceae bacterium]|nr:conjugative transposon protein TraM [Cyclobacteriaceae bacterium]